VGFIVWTYLVNRRPDEIKTTIYVDNNNDNGLIYQNNIDMIITS